MRRVKIGRVLASWDESAGELSVRIEDSTEGLRELSKLQARLLQTLVSASGRPIAGGDLVDLVWPNEAQGNINNLGSLWSRLISRSDEWVDAFRRNDGHFWLTFSNVDEEPEPSADAFDIRVLRAPLSVKGGESGSSLRVELPPHHTLERLRTNREKSAFVRRALRSAGGDEEEFRKALHAHDTAFHTGTLSHEWSGPVNRVATTVLPTRWASGGFFLLARWRGELWASFFFRDIAPVGLNVANGASEYWEEMTDLDRLIQRETLEEFVLLSGDPTTTSARFVQLSLSQFSQSSRYRQLARENLTAHRNLRLADGWSIQEPERNNRRRITHLPGQFSIMVADTAAREVWQTSDVFLTYDPFQLGVEIIRSGVVDLGDDEVLVDGEIAMLNGQPCLVRRPVVLLKLKSLYGLWERDGRLGTDAGEGRRLLPDELVVGPNDDAYIFPQDIALRRDAVRSSSDSAGTTVRFPFLFDDGDQPGWWTSFGSCFETAMTPGRPLPEPLRTMTPVAWKVIEQLFCWRASSGIDDLA